MSGHRLERKATLAHYKVPARTMGRRSIWPTPVRDIISRLAGHSRGRAELGAPANIPPSPGPDRVTAAEFDKACDNTPTARPPPPLIHSSFLGARLFPISHPDASTPPPAEIISIRVPKFRIGAAAPAETSRRSDGVNNNPRAVVPNAEIHLPIEKICLRAQNINNTM